MVSKLMNNHHAIKRKKEDDPSSILSSSMSFMNLHSTNTNNHTSHDVDRSTNYHHHRPNTTAVVYSPRNALNWTQCKNRLHTLLQQYNGIDGTDHDPVMDDIATISTHSMMKRTVLDIPLSSKLQNADEIASSMESDIQRIMKQVQNVSTMVSSLQSQYDTLQTYFTTTQHEIETVLQPQQQRHQQQIQQYHNAIAQYKHDLQSTMQHNYQTVPRLQRSISLYVSMTGIKWKYDDDGDDLNQEDGTVALKGEINIASKQMIRRFRIDITPDDDDDAQQNQRYKIAQQLWNMIDGYITNDLQPQESDAV